MVRLPSLDRRKAGGVVAAQTLPDPDDCQLGFYSASSIFNFRKWVAQDMHGS